MITNELVDVCRLGAFHLDGVTVRSEDPALNAEVDAACASFRERYPDRPSGQVPGVEEARGLYKSLGVDPTRYRPSNESLLRRALKGEPLYRINTAVDAINLCSLVHQLPYGLYDAGKVAPPIVLRKGREGESYEGIRKGPVSLGGKPTLADTHGAFGNPTSDSLRTSVSLETRALFVTVYAPRTMPTERLERILEATAETLIRHCGGTARDRRLV